MNKVRSTSQKIHDFKAGQIIFKEGETAKEMYYILEGEVVVYKEMEGRIIEVAHLAKGDIFGEMALLQEGVRTASVKAVTPLKTLKITKDNFDDKVRKNPEFSFNMLKSLSERLQKATDEVILLKYVISG